MELIHKMKYLKGFNEATTPNEYITTDIVSDIRDIEVPKGMRVKMRTESGNKELVNITGVSSFNMNILSSNRTKKGQYFEYSDIKEYLDSVDKLLNGRYKATECVVRLTPSIEKTFQYSELNGTMVKLNITYTCTYNNYSPNKFLSVNNFGFVTNDEWKDIFIDLLDLRFTVTCKYIRGAYQFTLSKRYVYGEEVCDLVEEVLCIRCYL